MALLTFHVFDTCIFIFSFASKHSVMVLYTAKNLRFASFMHRYLPYENIHVIRRYLFRCKADTTSDAKIVVLYNMLVLVGVSV